MRSSQLPRISWLFAILSLLILALPTTATAQTKVVTTTADLAAMARAILQEDGGVESLVRPSEDPHYVDPRPSFARHLNRADMILFVGMDLEVGWLPTLITRARNSNIQQGQPGYFNASSFIQARDMAEGSVDRSMGDVHPEGNPHYSTDPRQMARVALAFGRALGELEPTMADEFRERSREFARDCIRLAQYWEQKFAEIPDENKLMITYHKSWSYVAAWLGIEVVATIEPKPGVPANPRHIAQVHELIEARQVGVILQMEYYPSTTADVLAERTGIQLLKAPAQTREGQTYFEHIDEIVRPLHELITAISET